MAGDTLTTIATAPDERTVRVGRLDIRHASAGTGPPVVLLHGDGESWRSWSALIPALAESHQVLAPSLPGFGGSDRPPGPLTAEAIAATVDAFLEALDVGPAVLAGNSLGGLAAIRLALERPRRVRALALLASAGLGREVNPILPLSAAPGLGELAIAAARSPAGARQRALARRLLLFARPGRAPASWRREQVLAASMPGALEASLSARRAILGPLGQRVVVGRSLGAIAVPTLVVWGQRDLVFPAAHAAAALARLRRGRAELIPDCGHLPQLERPAETLAALRRLLAEAA